MVLVVLLIPIELNQRNVTLVYSLSAASGTLSPGAK